VRRAKARVFSGRNSHLVTVVPTSSSRGDGGGNEVVEALGVRVAVGDLASMQAVTCSER